MAAIVVIDSEPVVRTVVTKILELGGHSVHATGDFNHAVELLREEQPDLVVTNVFLRGITGHEAMLRLKTEFPGLRVLMVSGLPDEHVISEWIDKPGFDVFPKPFRPNDFLLKVEQVLAA